MKNNPTTNPFRGRLVGNRLSFTIFTGLNMKYYFVFREVHRVYHCPFKLVDGTGRLGSQCSFPRSFIWTATILASVAYSEVGLLPRMHAQKGQGRHNRAGGCKQFYFLFLQLFRNISVHIPELNSDVTRPCVGRPARPRRPFSSPPSDLE